MQETKEHKIYKERTRQVKWKTIIMTVQQILRFDKINRQRDGAKRSIEKRNCYYKEETKK